MLLFQFFQLVKDKFDYFLEFSNYTEWALYGSAVACLWNFKKYDFGILEKHTLEGDDETKHYYIISLGNIRNSTYIYASENLQSDTGLRMVCFNYFTLIFRCGKS